MSSYRKKELTIKILVIVAVVAIIIGLNIWWSISIYNQNYNMWLNEYNAQMTQLGYYKEDIRLLNQYATHTALTWQLVGNVIVYFLPLFGVIIYLVLKND